MLQNRPILEILISTDSRDWMGNEDALSGSRAFRYGLVGGRQKTRISSNELSDMYNVNSGLDYLCPN